MTRYFLRSLAIEGFRGINNEGAPLVLRFKTDAVNSVFGYNGAGKSSIFEAVQYAITGNIQKLKRLHQDEDGDDHYVNHFHSKKIATIELELLPDDGSSAIKVVVTMNSHGARQVTCAHHPDPESLLRSLDQELILLDYNTFREFVEDTPLRRGRAFAGLLGLARVSELRQILEVLSNQVNVDGDLEIGALRTELSNIKHRGDEAHNRVRAAYQRLFDREAPSIFISNRAAIEAEVIALLKSQPTIGVLIAADRLEEVDFSALRRTIEEAEGGQEQRELTALQGTIDGILALAATDGNNEQEEYQALRSLIAERDELIAVTRGALFKKLFESALEIVKQAENQDTRTCPLCGSTVDAPIEHLVTDHLMQFRNVEAVGRRIQEKWQAARFGDRLRRMEESGILDVPRQERRYAALDQRIIGGTVTIADLDEVWKSLQQLEARRLSLWETQDRRRQELKAKLPPSMVALSEKVRNAAELAAAMRDWLAEAKRYLATKAKLDRRLEWVKFVEDAKTKFAALDAALAKHRMDQIRAKCEDLFQSIMRTDSVKPAIERDEREEKVALRLATFYGLADVGAVALMSESYRNAFAMAVFLSAAMVAKPTARFMILDDITSSFDGGHQFNLLRAIRTKVAHPANPDGPQVIMLSHDGLLEKHFDTLRGSSWVHTRMNSTAPVGRVDAPPLQGERLRSMIGDRLDAGQPDDASRLVRQYLEFTLQDIVRKLKIPVPLEFAIQENTRLAGECVQAIRNAMDLVRATGQLILTQQQQTEVDNIFASLQIGNWLAHYSSATSVPMTPHAVRGVVQDIDRLADCFRYDCRCTGTAKREWYKSLRAKQCGC